MISAEEFVAFEICQLLGHDVDKDGKLSLEEWLALAGEPDDNPHGKPSYWERRRVLNQMFRPIDGNKDGFLDQAEFRTWSLARFRRIDLDGNGELDQSEWRKANTSTPRPGARSH